MLTFIMTMTLEEFKEAKKIDSIEIKQNPNTGKLYFVYGVETGAVSSRYDERNGIAVISLVETEKGEDFFLLHNKDVGSRPRVKTL